MSEDLREAALMLHRDPYDFFLGESDDYELVITCRPQDVTLLRSIAARCCPVPLTEVGRITGEPGRSFCSSPMAIDVRSNFQAGIIFDLQRTLKPESPKSAPHGSVVQ